MSSLVGQLLRPILTLNREPLPIKGEIFLGNKGETRINQFREGFKMRRTSRGESSSADELYISEPTHRQQADCPLGHNNEANTQEGREIFLAKVDSGNGEIK